VNGENTVQRKRYRRLLALMWMAWFPAAAAYAQAPSGEALVEALRGGGHVLVMRHAQSPRQTPSADSASAGNDTLERQLDETGRATAALMGEALRDLGIPVGAVLSSPTFRALETARHAGFGEVQSVNGLGDRGDEDRAAWLRDRAAVPPDAGTNTIMITHAPNVAGAFGDRAAGMADGETLIVRPDGSGGIDVVARVKIEDWPGLATAR
jgi:phosphohistidine phosphatase SixA